MKYKYRKINNTTLKGLKQAERLQSLGWQLYEVTPIWLYMRKEI